MRALHESVHLWIWGTMVLGVVGLSSPAPASIDCGAEVTEQSTTPPDPVFEPIDPHECTRWVEFRNCCPPPEHSSCGTKQNPVVLNVHWEVTGSSECRAGWDWPGGSCHSPRCYGFFAYIAETPGSSGDHDGDVYVQSAACKTKVTEHFGYDQKKVTTESFHYKGWCNLFGIVRDTKEQDCIRTKTEKIENCVIHDPFPTDCSAEADCQ